MTEPKLSIDALLREVGRRGAPGAKLPNESTVLAYLSGTATELEMRQVRAVVARVPEFRADLIAMAVDLERIAEPSLEASFDATDPGPAPRGAALRTTREPPPGWLDLFAAWLRRPALAFAVVVLLVAIPTYFLVSPDGSRSPIVSGPNPFRRDPARGARASRRGVAGRRGDGAAHGGRRRGPRRRRAPRGAGRCAAAKLVARGDLPTRADRSGAATPPSSSRTCRATCCLPWFSIRREFARASSRSRCAAPKAPARTATYRIRIAEP